MRVPLWIAVVFAPSVAHAEPNLSLDDAIHYAEDHHPAERADAAAERAAGYDVDAERARYVPDLELFAQVDRSTSNVAPGALFPAPALPVVAGAQGRTFDGGHWVSAGGVTATWDALGFLTWNTAIARAQAEVRLAHHEAAAGRLDVGYTAGDRFIIALERDEAVKAAQAGVDRAKVFVTIVKATVGSDLRAGADLSRADAELAFAQTALIRAEAALDVSQSELAEALGTPALRPTLVAGNLAAAAPADAAHPSAIDPHLAAAEDRANVAKAQQELIATGARPKLFVLGAIWGRGSGELTGPADFAHGLVPDVPNWALGAMLSWPVLASTAIGPETRAAAARAEREKARAEQVAQELAGRTDRAQTLLASAYKVAANTPLALKAASDAEKQITARYKAQLATVDDVAQVQRLLVQAETEDAVARLDVWRALLFRAYAAGDLGAFLTLYRGAH